VSGEDGLWCMIWNVIDATDVGISKWLKLDFVENLGAVPCCCCAMFCRGPTLDTSGGKRDFWELEGAQVGRVSGTMGEIIVVCTLGGGVPRGVGTTLGDSVGSWWGWEGGISGM
jgi:hypothetical protein